MQSVAESGGNSTHVEMPEAEVNTPLSHKWKLLDLPLSKI